MVDVIYPVILSALAGLATGLGALLISLIGKLEGKFLGFVMGFAGGVMLAVSFLELFADSLEMIPVAWVTGFFVVGAVLMMALDLLLPHVEFGEWERGVHDAGLFKGGMLVTIGMSLHNIPEGLIVSAGYSHEPALGFFIAVMICFHNIPEGIASVTPMIASGMDKRKAVIITALSGMTEPIGALLGASAIQFAGDNPFIIGASLAFAAGVMTYITLDELIPMAHQVCEPAFKHYISSGVICGIIFAQVVSILIGS